MRGEAARPRGDGERVPYRQVLAVAEFRSLYLAQLTSVLGDRAARVALSVLVFDRTHSPLLAAATYALVYAPVLLGGPALAALADLLPRRPLMVGCDLARAVLVGAMVFHGVPTPALFGLYLASALLNPPFDSARAATIPDVLGPDRYTTGQALGHVTTMSSQAIGFVAGGALIATLGTHGCLAVDAGSFAVSAVLVRLGMHDRPRAAVASGHGLSGYARDSMAGLRVVGASPVLRRLLALSWVGAAATVVPEGLAVTYAHRVTGGGPVAVGLLTAAVPAGVAIGAVALGRLVRPAQQGSLLRPLALGSCLPLLVIALRPGLDPTLALWALAGVGAAFQLPANRAFVLALDPASRGRAFSVANSGIQLAQGLALLGAGAAADSLGPAAAVVAAGVVGLAGITWLCLWRFPAALRPVPGRHSEASSSPRGCRDSRVSAAAQEPSALARDAKGVRMLTRWPRVPPVARVYALSVALIVATAALWLGDLRALPRVPEPVGLPWWVLLPVFTATTVAVIHFQFGRQSRAVTLCQVPLVVGLFLVAPLGLLAARVLGALVALVVVWRQPRMKVALNLASLALSASVALAVFAALRPAVPGVGASTWAAAVLAVLASDAVGMFAVTAAISLYEGRLLVARERVTYVFTLGESLAAAGLGLVAVAAIFYDSADGVLLALVFALAMIAYRSLGTLAQRQAGMRRLYEFSERLAPVLTGDAELAAALTQARELVLAEEVELALGAPGAPVRRVLARADGSVVELLAPPADAVAPVAPRVDSPHRLVVPLLLAGEVQGRLEARERLGNVRAFNGSDLAMLEALAGHVGTALERGLLLERLHHAATHDPLTGLGTLAELCRAADEQLVRGTALAFVLVDVLRLQDVNDSLGHEAGDEVLRAVGARLTAGLPPGSVAARTGGDEFLAAVPLAALGQPAEFATGLVTRLCGLVEVLGVTVDLRLRGGWALAGEHGWDSATLLRRAEAALGAARSAGVALRGYTPDLERDSARRRRVVAELRTAVETGAITFAYQPLVSARDRVLVGAEMLARWRHPELGVVPPDEFIPLAEQTGLIGALTELALDRACAQVAAWSRAGQELGVAVNVSARCLRDLTLPDQVARALAAHRVPPQRLTLELTETSVAEDPERALVILERLRGLGVRLSVDDFGTGYSSLGYLQRFPVQEVKLDRTFVDGQGDRRADDTIISSVVRLAHGLGLSVVAEGVEDAVTLERLVGLGVDVLQGYHVGRPGPATDCRPGPAAGHGSEPGGRQSAAGQPVRP